ncbi:MAG: NDP-sugar synthase [Candidatus Micrarchaeota archaeon]
MKAVLLAGGYGTRMFPLTLRTPKPLLPIAGIPVLEHSIRLLVSAGILDIVISAKENQKKLESYFGSGSEFGAKITYLYEPEVPEEAKMGSVGAMDFIFRNLSVDDDFIVIGGDNYVYGLNLAEFHASHSNRRAHASIALFNLQNRDDVKLFGVAKLDKAGRITKFQEKPTPDRALSTLASTAIYALDRAFIKKHLPEYVKRRHQAGEKADKIGDLWEHFVSDLHIAGHPFEGIWGDIGSCEGYLETNKKAFDVMMKNPPSILGKISQNSKIAKTAQLIPPIIIDDNCIVEEGAIIGPYVHLMHDSQVGKNCAISNSVVFERCKIGENSKIQNSIIDGEAVIGKNSLISDGSVVGYKVAIGGKCHVIGSKIYPGIRIDALSDIRGDLKNDLSPSSKQMISSCYWL